MTSTEWKNVLLCPACSAPLEIPMTLTIGPPDFLRDEVKVHISSDTAAAEEHLAAHTREVAP